MKQTCLDLVMKKAGMALLVVVALGAGLAAQQNTSGPGKNPGRIQITTRLVALFSELETGWYEAVEHKDGATLNRLLGEEFQVWTPASAGPVSREDWQRGAFSGNLQSFRLRQMAVRSLSDEIAVASFVLNERVQAGGKLEQQEFFVVDVWTKVSNHWLCTDRYTAPVASADRRSGAQDLRPSGKQ